MTNGPLPRRHPRAALCEKASCKIEIAIQQAIHDLDESLTFPEALRAVLDASNAVQRGLLRTMIRLERHGNAETPGDIE